MICLNIWQTRSWLAQELRKQNAFINSVMNRIDLPVSMRTVESSGGKATRLDRDWTKGSTLLHSVIPIASQAMVAGVGFEPTTSGL